MSTTHLPLRTTAAILAGPVVTLAGMAATPWESEATTASYQAALAAHPTQAQVAAVLLVFGYALLGLTALTVLQLAKPRAPRPLWAAAAVLTFLGATILPGMVLVDFYDLALAQQLPAADAIRVADAASGFGIGAIARVPALVGFMLGTVVLAATAWRGRLVGAWMPPAVLAGMLVPVVAGIGPAAPVVSAAVLVVAYAGVVLGVGRGPAVRPAAPLPATA